MCCRFSFFSAAVSVLCGVMVFSLFRATISPGFGTPNVGSGYAVLTVDEAQDDRRIRETLARGGLDGFISKSSQEVPIDDFGFLRMIPLDTFRDKIEPFDPRDTGYAGKLKSFFVRDGQRFFFLPLDYTSAGKTARLDTQIAALLPEIPFTLTVLGQEKPLFWYFALLAAAGVSALFISRSRRFFALTLPVVLAFGWSGPAAFILAALLLGIWELLREPLGELSAARCYQRYNYAGNGFSGLCQKLKPFRMNCFLFFGFLMVFAVFSVTAGVSPVPLAAAFVSLCLLYVLAFQAESERARKNRHIHFIPVPLLPFKLKTFSLFPLLLPFGLASMLALFAPLLPGVPPGIFPSPLPAEDAPVHTRYIVRAEDYYRHIDFQKSFSFRRLDGDAAVFTAAGGQPFINEPFLRYYLGEDGLIAGSTAKAVNFWTAPPFPLEKLMGFLLNYNTASPVPGASAGAPSLTAKEWISVAIIFAAWILNLLSPEIRPAIRPWPGGSQKTLPAFRDKRLPAWKAAAPAEARPGRSSATECKRRLPS